MSEKSTSSWFEEWFDSPYYHQLYSNRDLNEADQFIRTLAKQKWFPPQGNVLDLACGKGRHAQIFNDLGYQVAGVDLAANSIAAAKETRSSSIHFEVADMRSFELNQKFDVIANLFTSFGYFEQTEDNLKVLQRIHQHLKPGGKLVIDFLNLDWVRNGLVEQEKIEREGTRFLIQRRISETHILKTIEIDHIPEFSVTEKVQAIAPKELKRMLQSSGFEVFAHYGNYSLTDFNGVKSNRCIFAAERV